MDFRLQDLADIETILGAYGSKLAWDRVQEYFDLFELSTEGPQLRQRFDHAQ